ncbi:MAG: hypothetical protein EKK53_22940 [Burkholderiales bacterium]|nr:MAG: hypothetical protein EKK53_22940 [Burkholderiales bacterium]
MPALSPLSCPRRSAGIEHVPALTELRESIHRATAGPVARRERAERQAFTTGVLVGETTIRCWAAMVGPLVGPLRIPGVWPLRAPAEAQRLRV